MIVLSAAIDLDVEQSGLDPDCPILAVHNVVSVSSIDTTTEDALFPATNLANPATFLFWKGNVGSPPLTSPPAYEYITVSIGFTGEIDYVGIEGHNFGSGEIPVALIDPTTCPPTTLVDEFIPDDDGPLILRFSKQVMTSIQVRLAVSSVVPMASVLYAGKLLVVPRLIYVGHSPVTDALRVEVENGASENGQFLGRIVTREEVETQIRFTLLDPTWFRANMRAFLTLAKEAPFFFAWRPSTYPLETGYVWIKSGSDPKPVPSDPSHLIEVTMDIQGVVAS